jgi:hypothetical protein
MEPPTAGVRTTPLPVTASEAEPVTGVPRPWAAGLLGAAPIALLSLAWLLLSRPATRTATRKLLMENQPVELLTFVFLMAGGILALALVRRLGRRGESALVRRFGIVFATGLFLVAMEEIAWGQHLLGFPTPDFLRGLNQQGETTLHNLPGLHGRTEALRLLFGVGGLVGVALQRSRTWRPVAAPGLLLPWFAVIAAHAALDLYADFLPVLRHVNFLLWSTAELVELLIAIAALLYVALNPAWRADRAPAAG